MAGVEITVTGMDALVKRLYELGQDMPRVATRALNRTLGTVRTGAVRSLAKESGLLQSRIGRSIKARKANFTTQIATMTVSGKKIPLIAYGARQGAHGVQWRGAGRAVLPHSFIARMPSGHRGVFLRVGRKRLPIHEQFGPALPDTFLAAGLDRAAIDLADVTLAKNLEHEIDFVISQRAPSGDGSDEIAS